jgi:phage replication-related protein YjqB (UPF0714/DUF867 family)
MPDKYRNFAQLARSEREGQDYLIRTRRTGSPIFIIAPHGGAIEHGSSELTVAVAAGDLSFYSFEGIKKARNRDLHITSTRFDEPRSLRLLRRADRVVALHGEGRDRNVLFLGGLDTETSRHVQASLERHGFAVRPPDKPYLKGKSPRNICNRGRSGAGVQVEIAAGMRRTFFKSLTAAGVRVKTPRFRRFVRALREGLRAASDPHSQSPKRPRQPATRASSSSRWVL